MTRQQPEAHPVSSTSIYHQMLYTQSHDRLLVFQPLESSPLRPPRRIYLGPILATGWFSLRLIPNLLSEVLEEAILPRHRPGLLGGLARAQRLVGIAAVFAVFDGAVDASDEGVEAWGSEEHVDERPLKKNCGLDYETPWTRHFG